MNVCYKTTWWRQALLALCVCSLMLLSSCASEPESTQQEEVVQQTEAAQEEAQSEDVEALSRTIVATTKNGTLAIDLEDNSSADALLALLEEGTITIEMEDYANMEKVGPLGQALPTNDENISTSAGDVILYQGDKFVLYYDTNNWTLTRLGRVQEQDRARLEEVLGEGSVVLTLSID